MSFKITSPATIFEMAELGGARTQLHWAILKEMHANGLTWTVHQNGEAIAILGIYEADGVAECWFNPTLKLSRHMRPMIAAMRLTLAALDYPLIVVVCATEAGRRIASLAGFQFAETINDKEIWRYDTGIVRRRR